MSHEDGVSIWEDGKFWRQTVGMAAQQCECALDVAKMINFMRILPQFKIFSEVKGFVGSGGQLPEFQAGCRRAERGSEARPPGRGPSQAQKQRAVTATSSPRLDGVWSVGFNRFGTDVQTVSEGLLSV